jgi:hypothetical protein
MAGKAIYAALLAVQQGLKAPKDKSGGKYSYRSAEDILEKVKPLLQENGLILLLDEAIKADAVGSFIESTATLVDIATGDSVSTHSMAREDVGTKFMSPGQATGAAVSYARKYALGGMFAIDNEQDIDSQEYQQKRSQTAQNGAGRAQNAKPNNYTKAPTKASQNDDLMAKAKKQLKAEVDRIGCTWDEVKAISGVKIGKVKTEEMTVGEVSQLAAKLEQWILEESASA